MFLKTVPPVVAVHSEWRSSKSLSLPLCFNDSASDSDFTRSPIPRKVQMIIDSLCSTQSSDMSNDETNAQSGLNLPRHGGRKSCHMDVLTRPRWTEMDGSKHQASSSGDSKGSDSDDSIDRGIEEAIQEYLKEKVDSKHKMDPITCTAETPKVQQGDLCKPNSPKQLTHLNKVVTANNNAVKGLKGIQQLVDLKKKKPSKEISFRKTKAMASSGVRKGSTSCVHRVDKTPIPFRPKVKEDLDSSSDDGIEEAIQKFQQEEKDRQESLRFLHLDSSSDDGIEEAIRDYQQEKEHKCDIKQSHLMASQCFNIQPFKKLARKNNNRKKNVDEERKMKCASPKPVNTSLDASFTYCLKDKGKPEEQAPEQQIQPTFMGNTTAELMCAEAILDISKTVMPATYKPTLNLAKSSPTETHSFFSTGPSMQTDEKGDESSMDSEDGIEQEIRKFLELKAKRHEQAKETPSDSSTLPIAPQNKKVEENQNKALRLSFSRKRKRKEEDDRSAKQTTDGCFFEETQIKKVTQIDDCLITSHTNSSIMLKHIKSKQNSPRLVMEGLTSKDKDFRCSSISSLTPPRLLTGLKNNSDKSSSLDSDEDLDAAIKDLLKTKKKIKKKVRQVKLKPQKNLKHTKLLSSDKKHKPVIEQKDVFASKLVKPVKCSKDLTDISKQDKSKGPKSVRPQQSSVTDKVKTCGDQQRFQMESNSQPYIQPVGVEEDSSSVDSDDSIEQEIRRFLAEKAKMSTVPVVTVKQGDGRRAEEALTTVSEKVDDDQKDFNDALVGLHNTDPLQEKVKPQQIASVFSNLPNSVDSKTIKTEGQSSSTFCISEDRTSGQLERTLHECRNGSLDTDKDWALRIGEVKVRTCSDSSAVCIMGPQEPKCQAHHQNLFLMKPESCSINKDSEPSPVDLQGNLQNRSRIPLREVISTVCPSPPPTGISPISSPAETLIAGKEDGVPSSVTFYQHSCIKRGQQEQQSHPFPHIRHSFSKPSSLPPNTHLSCVPLPLALSQPHIGASMTRLRRDPVMAGSAPKNSHVQVRNVQNETERMFEVKEEEQEKCIDETDVESGEERASEQQRAVKQQISSQSLSTCIDPGELITPYITLNTEQRTQHFRHVKQRYRALKSIKKKLQFMVSMSR